MGKTTSVRLGELTERVDQEAERERRTRSQMIRVLIEEALDARGEGHRWHLTR